MLISFKEKENNTNSIWEDCLNSIERKVGEVCYNAWFKKTLLLNIDSPDLVIETQNSFASDYIEENHINLIKHVLNEKNIKYSTISFSVSPDSLKILPKSTNHKFVKLEPQDKQVKKKRKLSNLKGIIREENLLNNFIVGESNQLAYTSCMAVAEAPGKTSFNPLFIHGKTGLGKTHLLHGVASFIHSKETAENVYYLSGKEFIEQYMAHIKKEGNSLSFYRKFSNVDVLLIDDIHFLSGKPATQKEFYRIFNHLLMQKKQILLTSDRSPENLQSMMEHLINRFMGGLVLDIQPPDFETRMQILKNKASLDGVNLLDEVVQYIAGHITENIRELEGTLIKLIASASFTGTPITIETAAEIFGDVISRKKHRITTTTIQQQVANYFSLSIELLRAHTRKRSVTYPRNIAMYLSKTVTKQSLKTIGLDFGGRDYSTVIYACKKIETEIAKNPKVANDVENIKAILNHVK